MLLIGIDEAGYGPKIGPLCHGYSALRCSTPEDGHAPDLWQLLHPAVMRHPAHEGCIAVDDSKKIYSPQAGLKLLKGGVQSFLDCVEGGTPPEQCADELGRLYERLLPQGDRAKLEQDPWGAELPLQPAPDSAATQTKRKGSCKKLLPLGPRPERVPCLREALDLSRTRVLALGARALSARDYNAAISASGNKADVSWNVIAALFSDLLKLAQPGEDVYTVIDRQGGRKFYAGRISALFPNAFTWVEIETPKKSIYKIDMPERTVRVSFIVDGDGNSMPVALGSMAAKLARELCMARINAYFQKHHPELKPTAGYYGDANRFLQDTKALRKQLGISTEILVRTK